MWDAYLEVVECDQCGVSDAVINEAAAGALGWTWTVSGTSCPACSQTTVA